MKKMLAVIALLLGASFLYADDEITNSVHAGFGYPQTQLTWTTALNNVTPSVASSAIDCASYAGMLVFVTGTAASVQEQWSINGTSNWQTKVVLPAGEPYWRIKQSRYARFVFASGTVTELTKHVTVQYALQGYPTSAAITVTAMSSDATMTAAITNSAATVGAAITATTTALICPTVSYAVTTALSTNGQAQYVTCSAQGSIELTNWTASAVSACVEADASTITAVYNLLLPAAQTVVLTKEDYFSGGQYVKFFGAGTGNVSIKNRW